MALGAPRRARIRRKNYPRNVCLLGRLCAAILRARAARFFVGPVLEDSTFPPLTRLSGQRRSQDANAATVGNEERSGPISVSSICAVRELTPGTWVRSTPKAR